MVTHRRPAPVALLPALLLALSLTAVPAGLAQSTLAAPHQQLGKESDAAKLTALLAHLEDDLTDFNRTLPSFSCHESVVSEMTPAPSGSGTLRTSVDAIFRVRRASDPLDPGEPDTPDNITAFNELQESRTVTRINGVVPANARAKADSPFIVFGLFSGGLMRVSTEGTACFRYHLHTGAHKLTVSYESWPSQDRPAACPYTESISGEATIDPVSLRLLHLDDITYDDRGTWEWIIDYAPIALGGKTFWLPATIRSTNTSETENPGILPAHRTLRTTTTHSLTARYTDYHLRTVTSKIITDLAPTTSSP